MDLNHKMIKLKIKHTSLEQEETFFTYFGSESPLFWNGQFDCSVHILEVLALTYHPVINAISINNLLGCRVLGTISSFFSYLTHQWTWFWHASIAFTVNVKKKAGDLKLSKRKSLIGLFLNFFVKHKSHPRKRRDFQ